MLLQEGGESIGDGDDDGSDGSGGGGKEVYNGSTEPVLVSLSDSYSEDDSILVCDSRPSLSPTYTATDYCLNENVCNFVLRRTFYFSQLF